MALRSDGQLPKKDRAELPWYRSIRLVPIGFDFDYGAMVLFGVSDGGYRGTPSTLKPFPW